MMVQGDLRILHAAWKEKNRPRSWVYIIGISSVRVPTWEEEYLASVRIFIQNDGWGHGFEI